MNRAQRRHGDFTTVRGPVVAQECIDWMRSRRREQSAFTDAGERYWEPEWTPYVGLPDLPRWRITEKPLILEEQDPPSGEDIARGITAAVRELAAG